MSEGKDCRMNLRQRFISVCSVKSMLISVAAFMFVVAHPMRAQGPQHPLDGLTAPEIWTAYEVLHRVGKVDEKTQYPMVQLKEPPKEVVLAWKTGQAIRREAFLVVKKGAQTFEAVVDVNEKKLLSWTERKGVQPNMTNEELQGIDGPVKDNPEVQAALKRRGITDLATVSCGVYAMDYFGALQGSGRRLVHLTCSQQYGPLEDWGPIEGLTIVWDQNEQKVLSVKDSDIVPVPHLPSNYDLASVGRLRDVPTPATVQQPMGPSFRLEAQSVSWQKWHFHFRIDRRVGLVVDNVGYQDGDKLRSILYEGSLSELFMAYMDPGEGWYPRTFFDVGEDGSGFLSSLEPGEDCPENAVYFDQVYADLEGRPVRKPRAACLFEQPTGYMAWRHDGGNPVESRKLRQLVLRTIAGIDNYDYVFDWIFQQDGAILVRVGATGLDNVKAVKSPTAAQDPTGEASQYGRFIAENTVGVNHDHFFSFRLDFDVDGTANSFVRDKFQVQRLPSDGLRKSVWVAVPETAKTEDQAKARMSMEHPEIWRIINPNVKNHLGYPVGYQLMGGANAMSLMVPDDYPQKRAGFIDYQVWVTPYREDERYAAGDYPMGKVGAGLPAWTSANRAIENTDIVLWYTVGFHHVPHAEDWPVMPTVWHEFELRPFNFFDRNPALDLPK
jgi:primary-amine oxidase